jgi:hypothetical protein
MENIKIDGVIYSVDNIVYLLFLKLEKDKESALGQLETEIKAHLKCSNKCEIYRNYLIELVDTLKDKYILGDDSLYLTLLEIEKATK